MCQCNFSDTKYLDAVVILHPIQETSLMVLLGDYSYVAEQGSGRVVLGNLRHKNLLELDDDSIFQVANDTMEVEIKMLPVVEYLLQHPEDVVVLTADTENETLTWRGVNKKDKVNL